MLNSCKSVYPNTSAGNNKNEIRKETEKREKREVGMERNKAGTK